jgi:N-acetylglucosamine-6-phosphate deacetylase
VKSRRPYGHTPAVSLPPTKACRSNDLNSSRSGHRIQQQIRDISSGTVTFGNVANRAENDIAYIISEMAACVQLGHSLGTYDDAVTALKHGARGTWADVVVFDRELALSATYVGGESIVEYA